MVPIERCPVSKSEVVHKYSPRQYHNDQFTAPPSQLGFDDEDDGIGSSDGRQPVVRGRYGRRYDPVIIVERPTVTERIHPATGHSEQLVVTTSGGGRPSLTLALGVQLALSLLITLDWRTVALRQLNCCVNWLSASLVVSLYRCAALLR